MANYFLPSCEGRSGKILMEDSICEYAWQFRGSFEKAYSYDWEVMGSSLNATASHIWVFYRVNCGCIALVGINRSMMSTYAWGCRL